MLFAAISAKVPRSDMDLVHKYYEEFKVICPSFGDFQLHAIFVCWHANYGMVFDVKIEEKDKQAWPSEAAETDCWWQAFGFYSSETSAEGTSFLLC